MGTLFTGTATGAEPQGRVALIGIPGLRWGDVGPYKTPEIWRLAGEGSIGNIAVRGVGPRSCPADGWLTISAGERAQPPVDGCGPPPPPHRDGSGAVVPGFDELRAHNAKTVYAARVGLLGDTVRRAGGCTTAVGPGAALAAADSSGRVDHYAPSVRSARRTALECAVTIVDIDDIARAPQDRAAALAKADREVGRVLARLPAGTAVLLAGVADVSERGLRVVVQTDGPGYLTAPSTRRTGLVTLTDVTPTVLRLAGLPVPDRTPGTAWRTGPPRPPQQAAAVRSLQERDLAARIANDLVAPFNVILVGVQALVYGFALLLRRRLGTRQVVRCVALAAGAAPVATYLANLFPWWRAEHPAGALTAAVLAADAAVVALALAGPWRRHPIGPVTAVAAVTAATLAADAVTGSRLQVDGLNGNLSLTAGRFYGFGNLTFALFATACLLLAAVLATHAAASGHRRRAVALVAGIGAAAIAVDGWPGWGSDFGGVLALAPGVALLAMRVAGRRVPSRALLAAGGLGAVAVSAIAYLDHLRPPDRRSHLGDFWQRLLDGEAMLIVSRKADSMLNSLGSVWLTLLVPLPLLALLFVLLRPGGVLVRHAPALYPGLLAVLCTALTGFAVNDSGIAVLGPAALLAVPLTLAAALGDGPGWRRPACPVPPRSGGP